MVLLQHLAVQCTPENRTKVIAETLQVYSGKSFCALKRLRCSMHTLYKGSRDVDCAGV